MTDGQEFFGTLARIARRLRGDGPMLDVPDIESPRVAINPLAPPTPSIGWWHGEKYPGGLGSVNLLTADYWTLRQRSSELFRTNLYARGLLRRLVTNIVNTGLHLECTPDERLLGVPPESMAEWGELIECRFGAWEGNARLCHYQGLQTFGQLQATVKRESFISGDVLVVLSQDAVTKLPLVQVVDGGKVQSPWGRMFDVKGENRVREGVELDVVGRHVAYHVRQDDGKTSLRIPAFDRQGRRLAWLVYGCDKRHDEVRGEPILSLVVQSLREIDRYRDSVQRKAVINSVLAMFVKKEQPTAGTRPITGGALRRGTDIAVDSTGTSRSFNVAEQIPGLVLDELNPGEEPHGFQPNGTDEKFGDFEEAIIQAVAWAHEIPPEILRLAFSHNYAASQAANNEFNLYLVLARHNIAVDFCQPVFIEWLLSEALMQKFDAVGLLEAWRDPAQYDRWAAWTTTDWAGQIKPASDILKIVNAHRVMCEEGFELRSRGAREISGMKYDRFIRKLRRENEALAEALEPLKALDRPDPVEVPDDTAIEDQVDDALEEAG